MLRTQAVSGLRNMRLQDLRKIVLLIINIVNDICNGTSTGWTVRGSNRGGGEIFRTRPDRPWGLPSFLYSGLPGHSRG